MPGYTLELSDLNGGDDTSRTSKQGSESRKSNGGCYVSAPVGFVLMLLAILVAVGVGIIVHFAGSRDLTCKLEGGSDLPSIPGSPQGAVTACKDWIENGGAASEQICEACSDVHVTSSATVTMTTPSGGDGMSTTGVPSYDRDKYRLPFNIKPYHYTLRLQPHIYDIDPKTFFFEGSVTIDVRCEVATDVITLHVDRLVIDNNDVSVKAKASGSSVTIREISYEKEPHFYRIWLSESLVENGEYQIVFDKFRGNLTTDGHGLYYSSYLDGDTVVYLATTQFEAPYARKTFPCFDEPAMKATFDTTLVRKVNTGRNYRTLSNMNQLRSEPFATEWVADIYNTTMVMPTYLLAFIVCDYDHVSNQTYGITYSTWARPNGIQYAARAQEHGLKSFDYFESRFKPPYSGVINKMDNIAIPDFNAGAMENWGLITYRESLLYKPGVAATSDEMWIAEVIAHEITHMWFGNMVSPKWWSWLWLNEAFASFWDFYSVGRVYPTWRTTESTIVNGLHTVMTSDALASSHPMTADVETRQEISSIFDGVTYTKGSFVVRMMHFIMGEDKFIEALNGYLLEHQYGVAEHKDLWAALNKISLPDINMTLRMDPWVTQMGYPVVTVTRSGNGMLRLIQQRFLLGSEDSTDDRYKDPPYNYKWEIPITMASSQNPNFTKTGQDITWLEKDTSLDSISDPTVGEDKGWFVVNVQQYGYYRVNYDQQNWNNLIEQLNTDHTVIHPINRAQIINDAWNLVKAELLDMPTALKTLDYLSKEVDYVPWRAFAREMDYVELMLDRSPLYGYLETFMRETVSGPLQDLGLDITADLSPLDVYARVQIATYACSYGHPTCVNLAQQQVADWKSSGTNRIDPNLRYQFYCTAVERGDQTDWQFVYDMYKTETDAIENARLRRALACSKEPSLLRRVLEMTRNTSEIKTQDVRQTIEAVAANRWGRDIAFNFVVEHLVSLAGMMSFSGVDRLISSVTAHFNSPFHLTLLNLLQGTGDTSALTPAINAARAQTQANIEWLTKFQPALEDWLKPDEDTGGRINYRLPAQFQPQHYTVRLQPHIYGNDSSTFHFEGSCTIEVICTDPTNIITLHMDRLDIMDTDISVKQENSQRELFQSSSYEELRHFYHLHLIDTLEAGKRYVLEFKHFTGPLTTDGNGFYLSYYRDGVDTVYLATTQMEPPYARKTFPSFDEPALKATFDITLVRRNDTGRDYISLANAAHRDTSYIQDSEGKWWAEDHFQTTPIMPTYLLAFIVCDYKHLENITASDPSVTYRTFARPNAIQWAERAQDYGLQLFDWMDRRFEPKYGAALSKLDNVAVPDFNFGAMENWGLIIYREAILYQPGVTSASYEYWMGSVIAHELAHMWFGDYVSPKWWNWLWLNEAFASWWDVYVTEEVFPAWKCHDEWYSNSVYAVLESDALATSHPMTADVMTPAEINAIFDGVTYNKGAAIVGMMQFIMGRDTFIEGLNLYLATKLYSNADASDLFSALDTKMLQEQFGQDYMTTKMDPWVSQMGFPVVRVTRTSTGYQLTQQRFLIGSVEDTDDRYKDAPYDYQWEIPIIYATSDNTNMTKTRDDIHWLNKNQQLVIPEPTVNDTDAWILINVHQMAYCRVLYDDATWRALIGQLNTEPAVLPAINRGQIINDAWNLAKAGLLDMSVALSTLDFLQSETELVPWRAFAREINYVELMLERTDLFPLLKTYIQDTVEQPLTTLGLTISEGMAPVDVFVRTLIAEYACNYGLVGCVNQAKRLFTEWRNTGINEINANLRRQFYCTAVAEGGEGEWQFVYQQYKANDDTTELTNLRYALSCSKDQILLRRLLNMAIDPNEIRTQDVATTIQWVAENPLGRDLAFEFFVDKFEEIKGLLDVLYLGRTLISVTSHFNTDYNLQQLQQMSTVVDTTVVRSVVEQAIAQTRSNIAWLGKNYDVIKNWLSTPDVTQAPPPAGSYRLPTNVEPSHYDVSLQPHIYGNDSTQFFFEGNVTILLKCITPTDTITLHQDRLTIDSSSITITDVSNAATSITITDVTEEEKFHFYRIHLESPLEQGKEYSVQFQNFRGDMRSSGEGLYLSSYKDGDRTIYLATTQMEPTYARQVFPCFDEPALKATFNITLIRRTNTDRHYISLSNMPNISSHIIDSSWTADTFQKSMVMPTYLLAFIVCDYLYLSDMSPKYPVETRTYARPNRIQDAHTAQTYAVELFDWFNDRFDPKYETYLDKVDHIAIPDFTAGAMENWGLITYRENLLYNSMSTASDLSWIATVISHELAHMWFGNKVSPKWWTWLWLNEAFADYWEMYAVEQLHPNWKSESEVDLASAVFTVMEEDAYNTSHPLSNPVETPSEIMAQFDRITYWKGGAIIKMMHTIMGEHFIPALNVYVEDNKLGVADHSTLFDSLNKYISTNPDIDLNMTKIMEPWVTQMGYPVVNVHRMDDQLHLTQEKFWLGAAPPSDTGAYGYKYEVPITFTTSSEKNFTKHWTDIQWLSIDQDSATIQLPSASEDWVVINLLHEGYYRVNYDSDMWKALIGQLNTDHKAIHTVNRAALLDDAWNLVKADLLPLETALQTLDYLKKETEYGPWRVFVRETDHMALLIERTELFADFQRFIQELVDEPLKTIGLDFPEDNVPPIEAFSKSWLLSEACAYDQQTCVNQAKSLVSDWMNGLGNMINVNIRSVYYCTAVREGGHDVWDFIYQQYQSEQDSTEKSRLRSALGCSKDPTILYTFLDMCLYDDDVPRSETSSCVSSVASNRYGRDVALNFVMEHFPVLLSSFSSSTLGGIVDTVTRHFQTNFHLAQIQFLMDTYDVSGITKRLETIKERTVTNMKWMSKNFDIVKQWLDSKTSGPGIRLNYRLPTTIKSTHYDLILQPEIYSANPQDFTFNGTVTISVQVQEPTSTITLHSYLLDQQSIRESARLMFENGTDTGYVTEVTFDEPRHFLNLHLSQELQTGESLKLFLAFSGTLTTSGVGLYYTFYQADDGSTVYLATTKFEAPYARRAFPCFDEPELKATVNTTLIRRQTHNGRSYKSWSNNELLYTSPWSNGYESDVFATTPVTPTYLLAFIVADFECLHNDTKHSVLYRTCARPNAYTHGQLAQDWGLRELEWLEDHFDPVYIMPKLDNMAIPDFLSGAMENWGLVTYRETLLYEDGVTSTSDMVWIPEVVAHELAHMWFGNIVSPKWWNWLWLNEAFASFYDFHLVEILQSDWRMTDMFMVQSVYSVMSSDSLTSSHPLTADVESPSEIQAIFDGVTYTKGAAIVRMMNFIMGETDFIGALNVYLHNRQYDVADHTDLFNALDEYSANKSLGLNMTDVMEAWVTQMNYPVVNVTWTTNGQVTMTQRRFLSSSSSDGDTSVDQAPFGYTWDVPITISTSTTPTLDVTRNDIHWFKKSESQFTVNSPSIPSPPTQSDLNRWLLVNVQQYGYYRVNYDDNNWLALIQQLKTDPTVIPPINRGQIINDAWSLARSGYLNMNIALQTLQVLRNDGDYVPWRAISGELSYLDLMLDRAAIYGLFEDYMVLLVNSTYHSMGITSNPNDPPIDIFQRQRIVRYACDYGVKKCQDDVQQLFAAWRTDPVTNSLDVDMRGLILCNGIRLGEKEDWEFVYDQYMKTSPGSEKSDLRSAMACSTQSWLLHRLMDMTLNSSIIRAQDVRSVLQAVSSNTVGRDLAYDFLKEHFDVLPNFMTPGSFGRMVVALTQHFNTQQQLDEVKQFMAQNDVSMAQTAFRQVVEQTSVNMKWMDDYYDVIRVFLENPANW